MKKQSLIIIAFILLASYARAQNLKANTTIKTNKITYKVDEVKMHGALSAGVSIVNVKNVYHGHIPKVSAGDISLYDKIEKGSMLKSFTQVFNDSRLKQLTAERAITLFLYVSPVGKVSEVSFVVNKNTSLTASELEQLENAVKANVSFQLRPDEAKGGDFFILPLNVRYQNVLDRIER